MRHLDIFKVLRTSLIFLLFSFFLLPQALGLRDTLRMSDFGLAPDSRVNAVPYVQKALAACKANPDAVLLFEQGRYDFWPHHCQERVYYESNTTDNNPRRCAILIEEMMGLTIDCGGADFVFHDRMQPFTVDRSERITIKNVSIDWDIPLTAQSEILEVTPEWIDIRIDRCESPYVLEGGKIIFVGEGWKSPWRSAMEFDRETRAVAYKTGDWGCLGAGWRDYRAGELEPGVLRLHYPFKRLPRKGNLLVMRHSERDHSGVFITESRNVTLIDLRMYHNCGLGILSQYSEDLTFTRVDNVPNPAKDRILAGHDDGFQVSNCRGQVTIEECRFHALMDDPVNVHGTSVRIIEKRDDRTLLCRFIHDQSIGMPWARPGESVGFIDGPTLATVAEGRVESFNPLDTVNFVITFVAPVPARIKAGDALENLTWTPDVLITGSLFESCRARGVLITTPGRVVIENNRFESSGSAILISGDANQWYESGGVKDILIRNNHFTDLCLTSMYQFCEAVISIYPVIPQVDPTVPAFHRNIRIEENRFDLYDYPVLFARSVDGLTFTGNTLNRSNRFEPWHPRKVSVTLEACKNVLIENNRIDPELLGRTVKLDRMKKGELRMMKGQFLF
ncbi:MAG: right-handed parallel beta-helix repeat-containing protein [Bacteroidales bacterium]